MNIYESQKRVFRRRIWHWHRTRAPRLPWRETTNPYHIFVSEVMLQQTQIPRVLKKYPLFLKRFPTVKALARATLLSVLKKWQGMGYNRRGLFLKQAAQTIVREHDGKVPKSEDSLRKLSGIGPYSARAILCFAHGVCEPFLETNIRRVIIHEFFPHRNKVDDKEILAILEQIQPKSNRRDWYYALMDYGRDALVHIPNPNRKSKHYTKQSKFIGSDRYIRAAILRELLQNKKATAASLALSLQNKSHVIVASNKLEAILLKLKKEGLIRLTSSGSIHTAL